ncbi:MAG TPA: DNA mismatch repair endonuclease MutL, partial [Candidatus Acidoferrum sp.]
PTQQIIDCAPVERLAERIYQLFGKQSLDELVEIPTTSAAFGAAITESELEPNQESARISVYGFTSRPEIQRPNRNGIYVFVNRRLVRDRLILHAIHEAYRNILPGNVFPATLLFLEMPYDEVDVNVHPAKIEVRFRRSQFVHDFTRDSIRQVLMSARSVQSFAAAAGGSATAMAMSPGASAASAVANASSAQPAIGDGIAGNGASSPPNPASATFVPRAAIPALEDVGLGSSAGSDSGFDLTSAPLRPVPQRFSFETGETFAAGSAFGFASPLVAPASLTASAPVGSNWAANLAAANGNGEAPARLPHPDEIADLKPLGQVSASFIIAVNGEGLWIVDQHVAHERVLFEQHLEARRAGKVESQRMLMPMILELSPRQLVIYEKIAAELSENGFEVEPMGPRSVAIQAVPAGVTGNDAEKLLTEILDGIERENAAISIETLQAKIAASTACHAAIKVNMPLDQTKMEWLLAALAKTDCPMSCPHGRPVVLRYSVKEIERAFHRI